MSTIWHELWHNREREDNNRQQVLENIKLIYLIYQILTHKNTYGEEIKYYEQVDHLALERSKNIIKKFLQEGLVSDTMNKEEFDSMDPSNMNLSRFRSTY